MKSVFEILIGALVFIFVDRFCKVVSSSIVDKSGTNTFSLEKVSLRIELLTLFVALFIAFHFIKF
jgi:hypothetical protein